MKLHHLTAIGLAALLAACGQKTEDETAANAGASAGMSGEMRNMGNMDMPADMPMKMANGTGMVTAIDKVEGSITIDHGPIPEANWPAMTMAFKAKPELLHGVEVGNDVTFEVRVQEGSNEVTAITRQ